MSSVDTGNARVDALGKRLSKLGYTIAPLKASGRRGQRRRDLNFASGDLLAWTPVNRLIERSYPSLLIEVGGRSKSIRNAFKELTRSLPPTFSPMVVLVYGRKQHYYVSGGRYQTLSDALNAIKES